MKVSIVTISFNQAGFLERAIRSVLQQDHDDIEYMVVDAGSTDGSRDIIERYGDRIAKVIFEPDDGPADGLNKGFAQATGEICGYINADDAYLPGAVRKAQQVFAADPSLDVVHAHGYIVDRECIALRRFRSDRFDPWRFAYGAVVVMQQSTFFKREAFEAVGGFNPDNRIWWDAELLLDLCLAGKSFKLVNDYWAIFTLHEASISGVRRLKTNSDRFSHLAKEAERTRIRLFEKVMKRPPTSTDAVLRLAAYLRKWLGSPVNLFWRIAEELGLKPVLPRL